MNIFFYFAGNDKHEIGQIHVLAMLYFICVLGDFPATDVANHHASAK